MPVATMSYNHVHSGSSGSLRSRERERERPSNIAGSGPGPGSGSGYSPTSSTSAYPPGGGSHGNSYSPVKSTHSSSTPTSATASPIDQFQQQQQQQQHYQHTTHQGYPNLPPPAREFLINVEMWVAAGSGIGGKGSGKIKSKTRSRPSSTLFSPSSSTTSRTTTTTTSTTTTIPHSSSHDDLSAAHSTLSPTGSVMTNAAAAAAIMGATTTSSKTAVSSIFSSATERDWGGQGYTEAGSWRPAVCKLSGEGGSWPSTPLSPSPSSSSNNGLGSSNNTNAGAGGAPPTGSALLTIYSSDDNTLQHVINIHKLTSTDVRPCDKSLFNRTDVLALWGHPAAMSLSPALAAAQAAAAAAAAANATSSTSSAFSTLLSGVGVGSVGGGGGGMGMLAHPALFSPIYLSFSSQEAHNTWLVLLRSYTAPEVYGRLIHPEQGGLYRMWRQVELVVVQSRGVNPSPGKAIEGINKREVHAREVASGIVPSGVLGATSAAGSSGGGSKSKGESGSRPGTANTIGGGGGGDGSMGLILTNSHNPSVGGGSSATTLSSANGHAHGHGHRNGDSPTTPTTSMAGTSLKSWSTTSLPNSLDSATPSTTTADPSHSPSHPSTGTTKEAKEATKAKDRERKDREKREKEKEKEREKKEKERKEREKKEAKKMAINARQGFFAEILLDGEVCGRTTVKRPPAVPIPQSLSTHSAATAAAAAAAGQTTLSSVSAISAAAVSAAKSAEGLPTPEWFENFHFGDLPSFGTLLVMLWRAPEKKEKEREGEREREQRPRSAKGEGAGGHSGTTVSSGGGGAPIAPTSSIATGTTLAPSSSTYTSNGYGGHGGGVTTFGGAKGSIFLGCVEIALPNFRRGEWVEGWWPVYHHANQMYGGGGGGGGGGGHGGGGVGVAGHHGPGSFSGLGMGAGAMGLGGLSGVGGVAGALVQVGEMKLRIKVDEEIILPSKAYKNVLDALEQRNYLDVLSELEHKLAIQHSMIAPHIVSLAVARNRLLKDIIQLAEREVAALAGSTNTLFRGNTVLTKTMELAMGWYGRTFLDASVGPIIRRMIKENVEIEIDPAKLRNTMSPSSKRPSTRDSFRPSTRDSYRPGTKDSAMNEKGSGDPERDAAQEHGTRLLEYWCNELWNQMYIVRMDCPVELRRLFGHIRMMVERKFNTGEAGDPSAFGMLPRQAISSFVFLRFIVPAILNPHLSGLCPGMPPAGVGRSLTLLAKCTQTLANLNPDAPPKEEYMRGISNCLRQNTVTMIDYLACVSSLPDQFSSSANTSSFLSGPDKHDRLHVIHSLRERLTGAGNTIPTLYKDAIPLLPYALDVPKHLAILSSSVVRNARSGTGAPHYVGRAGPPGSDVEGWTLGRFSELCFDVEAQALKSVATLAQGAASAGAFNGVRAHRSTSVSSTGGAYQQSGSTVLPGSNLAVASGSRGVTPTGPSTASATTPTQTTQSSWTSQGRRPTSSRSITTPTGPPSASLQARPGSASRPGSSGNAPSSPSGNRPTIALAIPAAVPPSRKRKSVRPSTAPTTNSAPMVSPTSNEDLYREPPRMRAAAAPDISPSSPAFRYLPPDQVDPRRAEDVALPETPISPSSRPSYNSRHATTGSAGAGPSAPPGPGYQTIHRSESESFVAFHYPTASSRFQASNEALKQASAAGGSGGNEKSEKKARRASSSRIRDFMKRPSTSSGAMPSRPKWGDENSHSSSGEELGSHGRKRGAQVGSLGGSSGEGYSHGAAATMGRRSERVEPSGSGGSAGSAGGTGETKKKRGFFGWLGGKSK